VHSAAGFDKGYQFPRRLLSLAKFYFDYMLGKNDRTTTKELVFPNEWQSYLAQQIFSAEIIFVAYEGRFFSPRWLAANSGVVEHDEYCNLLALRFGCVLSNTANHDGEVIPSTIDVLRSHFHSRAVALRRAGAGGQAYPGGRCGGRGVQL